MTTPAVTYFPSTTSSFRASDDGRLAAVAQNLRKLVKLIGFSPPGLSAGCAESEYGDGWGREGKMRGSGQLARLGRMKVEPKETFPAICGDQAAADAFPNVDLFTDILEFCTGEIFIFFGAG